jgi:hypothetical protein
MEQPSSDQPEVGGVAITRRLFIAAIVAVCVLSAAIGSAIGLIAQTGPAGPRGERGPRGPRGPQGSVDTGTIEAEIEAVRSEADTSELEEEVLENEERLEGLEDALRGTEHLSKELCDEGEIFYC